MTQEELLVQIHNQLVDLKKLLVEIELARPGTTHSMQTRLRSIMGNTDHIDADGRASDARIRAQKVIAPTDPNIQPGEATDQGNS